MANVYSELFLFSSTFLNYIVVMFDYIVVMFGVNHR